MLRRPPRSTLFPYHDALPILNPGPKRPRRRPAPRPHLPSSRRSSADICAASRTSSNQRSEEHTSELQSHSDLVCRLLLEKKKKIKIKTTDAPRRMLIQQ